MAAQASTMEEEEMRETTLKDVARDADVFVAIELSVQQDETNAKGKKTSLVQTQSIVDDYVNEIEPMPTTLNRDNLHVFNTPGAVAVGGDVILDIPPRPPPFPQPHNELTPAQRPVSTNGNSNLDHQGLIEAEPVVDPEQPVLSQAQRMDSSWLQQREVKRRKMDQKSCRIGMLLAGICCAVLALFVGIYLVRKCSRSGDSTRNSTDSRMENSSTLVTPPPLEHLELLYQDLPPSTKSSLSKNNTPQRKAWHWLLSHQNITQLEEWRKKQLFALSTFYHSMEGPSWPNVWQQTWLNDSVDECHWSAVDFDWIHVWTGGFLEDTPYALNQCNDEGMVQSIFLSRLGLHKKNKKPSVPTELTLLPSLKVLALPFNGLDMAPLDLLPLKEISQSTSITHLMLHANKMLLTIPAELAQWTSLQSLFWGSNRLTGPIPSEVGLMNRLTSFYLRENQCSGMIPSEMGLLTDLNDLDLNRNLFGSSIPSQLGTLANLSNFQLASNMLSGTIPSELGNLESVTHFSLDQNQLSGSIFTEIGLLADTMKRPYLYVNQLTGPIPSQVGLLTSTTDMQLFSNLLTGSIPSEIGSMTNLIKLDLSDNQLSASIPTEINMLTQLVELDLSELPLLTGSLPIKLNDQKSLGKLNLKGSHQLSGTIPDELCTLQEDNCTYVDLVDNKTKQCSLDFDCGYLLCGCGCQC